MGYRSFTKKHLGGASAESALPPDDNAARNKRGMVIGFDGSYRVVLPVPDGAITVADRYQLTGKYYGLGIAPPTTLIFRNRTGSRMRIPYHAN